MAGPNYTTVVNMTQWGQWKQWNSTPPIPSNLSGFGSKMSGGSQQWPANWGQSANWTPPAPPINVTPMSPMPVLRMPGYTLGPGQSATFTFEGTITLGPRLDIGGSNWPVTITVTPIVGQSYGITAMTIPASNASATVTAG